MSEKSGNARVVGVDADIGMVTAGIQALRDLVSDPEKARDSARVYDFSIRWGVLLSGRLKRLEHYYREGELSEEEEARYRDLRRELGDAMPLVERLGIGRPDIPLED